MATNYDLRTIGIIVRDALALYGAQQVGQPATRNGPLAEDLAARIVDGLLPALRDGYLEMVAMAEEWQDAEFQAQLAAAAVSGALVAGYPAATWIAWGKLLLALQAWLETPIEALKDTTPKSALLKRYQAGNGAQLVAVPQ